MKRAVSILVLCFAVSLLATAQDRDDMKRGQHPQAERITNGPVVEGVGRTWAVIAWTTNTGGSTVVHYGMDRNNLSEMAEAPYADNDKTQSQNHRVHINNLQPGKTYYFQVDSGQGEGTGSDARGPIGQFRTKDK